METIPADKATERLKLHTHAQQDATLVRCVGRLTMESAPLLKTEVKGLIAQKKRVILDLHEVVQMDSSGLGALVALYISSKGANCEFRVVNMSKPIRELLSLSNLLLLFESCGRSGTRPV
jgi:anti-sigma B factor antagonist